MNKKLFVSIFIVVFLLHTVPSDDICATMPVSVLLSGTHTLSPSSAIKTKTLRYAMEFFKSQNISVRNSPIAAHTYNSGSVMPLKTNFVLRPLVMMMVIFLLFLFWILSPSNILLIVIYTALFISGIVFFISFYMRISQKPMPKDIQDLLQTYRVCKKEYTDLNGQLKAFFLPPLMDKHQLFVTPISVPESDRHALLQQKESLLRQLETLEDRFASHSVLAQAYAEKQKMGIYMPSLKRSVLAMEDIRDMRFILGGSDALNTLISLTPAFRDISQAARLLGKSMIDKTIIVARELGISDDSNKTLSDIIEPFNQKMDAIKDFYRATDALQHVTELESVEAFKVINQQKKLIHQHIHTLYQQILSHYRQYTDSETLLRLTELVGLTKKIIRKQLDFRLVFVKEPQWQNIHAAYGDYDMKLNVRSPISNMSRQNLEGINWWSRSLSVFDKKEKIRKPLIRTQTSGTFTLFAINKTFFTQVLTPREFQDYIASMYAIYRRLNAHEQAAIFSIFSDKLKGFGQADAEQMFRRLGRNLTVTALSDTDFEHIGTMAVILGGIQRVKTTIEKGIEDKIDAIDRKLRDKAMSSAERAHLETSRQNIVSGNAGAKLIAPSLLSPFVISFFGYKIYRFGEQDLVDTEMQLYRYFNSFKANNSTFTFTVNGVKKTYQPKIIGSTWIVNRLRYYPRWVQSLFGMWKSVYHYDKEAIRAIRTEARQHVSMLQQVLVSNLEAIKHSPHKDEEEALMGFSRTLLEHMEEIVQVVEAITHIWNNAYYQKAFSNDPFIMPKLILHLSWLLDISSHFRCKSGKDRTVAMWVELAQHMMRVCENKNKHGVLAYDESAQNMPAMIRLKSEELWLRLVSAQYHTTYPRIRVMSWGKSLIKTLIIVLLGACLLFLSPILIILIPLYKIRLYFLSHGPFLSLLWKALFVLTIFPFVLIIEIGNILMCVGSFITAVTAKATRVKRTKFLTDIEKETLRREGLRYAIPGVSWDNVGTRKNKIQDKLTWKEIDARKKVVQDMLNGIIRTRTILPEHGPLDTFQRYIARMLNRPNLWIQKFNTGLGGTMGLQYAAPARFGSEHTKNSLPQALEIFGDKLGHKIPLNYIEQQDRSFKRNVSVFSSAVAATMHSGMRPNILKIAIQESKNGKNRLTDTFPEQQNMDLYLRINSAMKHNYRYFTRLLGKSVIPPLQVDKAMPQAIRTVFVLKDTPGHTLRGGAYKDDIYITSSELALLDRLKHLPHKKKLINGWMHWIATVIIGHEYLHGLFHGLTTQQKTRLIRTMGFSIKPFETLPHDTQYLLEESVVLTISLMAQRLFAPGIQKDISYYMSYFADDRLDTSGKNIYREAVRQLKNIALTSDRPLDVATTFNMLQTAYWLTHHIAPQDRTISRRSITQDSGKLARIFEQLYHVKALNTSTPFIFSLDTLNLKSHHSVINHMPIFILLKAASIYNAKHPYSPIRLCLRRPVSKEVMTYMKNTWGIDLVLWPAQQAQNSQQNTPVQLMGNNLSFWVAMLNRKSSLYRPGIGKKENILLPIPTQKAYIYTDKNHLKYAA